MIIYKTTNKINGMVYIGKTIQLLVNRKYTHKNFALSRRDKTYFHNAIRKYGFENFKWEVLCKCIDKKELDRMEKFYIKFYRTKGKIYNLTNGGDGLNGYIVSIDTRKKISISNMGRISPMKGKKHKEESKLKASISNKGKHSMSYEHRQKISKVNKGRIPANKRKIKNIDTGEIFGSICEAARYYNIIAAHITNTCKKDRKTCGGFHWKYAN